jgi:hypothetical protein
MMKIVMEDQEVHQIFYNSYLHIADIFNKISFTKWAKLVL